MTFLSQQRPRISVRQAIVVFHEQSSSTLCARFAVPAALDLLGTMVAVNGVSLIVTCATKEGRRQFAKIIPAGVELLAPPSGQPAIGWAARELVSRGFERVVFVASDVLGLPARVLSTAMSAVDVVGILRADTADGEPYLIGFSAMSVDGVSVCSNLSMFEDAKVMDRIRPTRGFERFPRLGELQTVDQLRTVATASPALLPRVCAAIDARIEEPTDQVADDERLIQ